MSNEKSTHDLLAAILPGLSMSQQIEQARVERERKKAEYDAAQARVDEFTKKENRDKIRAQKRRDEIIGNLFASVCVTSPDTWAEFQPHLAEWLKEASDADRALFGLKQDVEPPKGDTEEGSKAAAPGGEQKPDPVQQPAS